MEQKYNAPIEKVFALLTDPKWLETRSRALGELSAQVRAKKSGGGVTLTMKRRVKRDLPGLPSKVLSPESVPLVGGAVERFALAQVEQGCADEFVYLVNDLKAHK